MKLIIAAMTLLLGVCAAQSETAPYMEPELVYDGSGKPGTVTRSGNTWICPARFELRTGTDGRLYCVGLYPIRRVVAAGA